MLAMVRDLDLSGWTMLTVSGRRLGLRTVDIMPGDPTTVITMRMSLSAATPPKVESFLFFIKDSHGECKYFQNENSVCIWLYNELKIDMFWKDS